MKTCINHTKMVQQTVIFIKEIFLKWIFSILILILNQNELVSGDLMHPKAVYTGMTFLLF